MLITKVVGSAVATIKDENLVGTKLLVVREADIKGEKWFRENITRPRSSKE